MSFNFSRIESLLLAWPDELPDLSIDKNNIDQASKIAVLIRRQCFKEAEHCLLSAIAMSLETAEPLYIWLLIYLRLRQNQYDCAERILRDQIPQLVINDLPFELLDLQLQFARIPTGKKDLSSLSLIAEALLACKISSPILRLMCIAMCFRLGDNEQAGRLIEDFQGPDCLELHRFKARLLKLRGESQLALDELIAAIERFPSHKALIEQLTHMSLETRSAKVVLPALKHALHFHGESPGFLGQLAQVKLIQREPSLARRCSLLDRTWASVDSRRTNITNQITSYEQCGNVFWFPFILHHLRDPSQAEFENFELMSNLCCQYASIESPLSKEIGQAFFKRLSKLSGIKQNLGTLSTPKSSAKTIKVAWISGDISPHPVSRFLLSFLENSSCVCNLEHKIISTVNHNDESNRNLFDDLPNVNVIEIENTGIDDRIAYVQEQQSDIAVDLSGWTGGNFQAGFLARLAPVQINYLGYFASTNNPNMDYWLGDNYLFPSNVTESHSETIHRLDRCFIAWKPSQHFPEANAQVTPPPKASGIRFGSFNHNRKLSDATLALWGKILTSLPGSRLVLKANSSFDDGTQILLRRRMLRNGLDPELVIWLPLTATTDEHLEQYSHIDIALDCFPNGGCTTTCEALWMGTPVITLTGNSYVSRMSTAVLNGAGLSSWCTRSPQEYLDLAIEQHQKISWLRENRDFWRNQILKSPLGDASDLMRSLAITFKKMLDSA